MSLINIVSEASFDQHDEARSNNYFDLPERLILQLSYGVSECAQLRHPYNLTDSIETRSLISVLIQANAASGWRSKETEWHSSSLPILGVGFQSKHDTFLVDRNSPDAGSLTFTIHK